MDYIQNYIQRRFRKPARTYSRLSQYKRRKAAHSRFSVKTVKKAYHLPIETAVVVPSTINTKRKKGIPISPKQFARRVEETRSKLSKYYGGYTSVSAVGGYVYRKGKLKGKVATEQDVVVTSYATKASYHKNKAKWLAWVRAKRKSWKQESVGIIIENDMYYV